MDITILRAAFDDALRGFETATAQHDSARANYWLGACVALRRLAQQAGVTLEGDLPASDAPDAPLGQWERDDFTGDLVLHIADDPDDQWEQAQAARQEQAQQLYQIILDQAPDEAVATMAAAIQAVVAPQLAAQAERRARQLYNFLELARDLEDTPDDHTERWATMGLVFAASVELG